MSRLIVPRPEDSDCERPELVGSDREVLYSFSGGDPSSFCLADAGCDFDGLVVGMSLMGAEQFRSVAGGGAQGSRFLAGGVYARAGLFSRKLIA